MKYKIAPEVGGVAIALPDSRTFHDLFLLFEFVLDMKEERKVAAKFLCSLKLKIKCKYSSPHCIRKYESSPTSNVANFYLEIERALQQSELQNHSFLQSSE